MCINKYSLAVACSPTSSPFVSRIAPGPWIFEKPRCWCLLGKAADRGSFLGQVSTSFPPQERRNVSHVSPVLRKKTGGEGYKPYKLSFGLALEEHWSKDIYPYLCCKAILREHVGPANRVQRAPDLCGVQPQMTSPDLWGRYPCYEQLICGNMLNTLQYSFQWQKCVECCALLA